MHLTRVALIATALALPASLGTLSGCQSSQSITDSATMIQKLAGDWNLASLKGTDIASLMPKGVKIPSLSFTPEGKVSGTGGINRLASSLDLEALAKGEFKLAPTASTKMAGSPEAMDFEDSFLKTLGEVTGFSVKGDSLSLSGAAGELMQFVRAK
jgi:heat shock protein HslJ